MLYGNVSKRQQQRLTRGILALANVGTILVNGKNGKDLSWMKACKKGLKRAYNHGQHVLDKQDRDIYHAAIDNTL